MGYTLELQAQTKPFSFKVFCQGVLLQHQERALRYQTPQQAEMRLTHSQSQKYVLESKSLCEIV